MSDSVVEKLDGLVDFTSGDVEPDGLRPDATACRSWSRSRNRSLQLGAVAANAAIAVTSGRWSASASYSARLLRPN